MIKATNTNHGIIKSPLVVAFISFLILKRRLFSEKIKEETAPLQADI